MRLPNLAQEQLPQNLLPRYPRLSLPTILLPVPCGTGSGARELDW